MSKLRELAEIIFTNLLFVGLAMLIFAPAHAGDLRHIVSKTGEQALVLMPTLCDGAVAPLIKAEYKGKVFNAAWLWKDGRVVKGCYMDTPTEVQVLFEDGDAMIFEADKFSPGPPVFGAGT